MSIARRLLDKGRRAVNRIAQRCGAAAAYSRVVVVQPAGDGRWRAIEADVGGEQVIVFGAQALGNPGGLTNNADIVLLADARRAVCRFLELADASPDDMRRMAALRLEAELPYPVEDSTWACQRHENGAAGKTLIIATASADLSRAEAELRVYGKRCHSVELDVAGLAELAVAARPADDRLAIAAFGITGSTLAIVHKGSLAYARHIPMGVGQPAPDPETVAQYQPLANELSQSIYDYLLRPDSGMPERLLLAGEGMDRAGLAEALEHRLGMPVEQVSAPVSLQVADSAGNVADLLARFPDCAGAAIAVHRRRHGQHTAAPALRPPARALGTTSLRRNRATLAAANVALFAAVVAALFGVQGSRLRAAERLIEESRSMVHGLERLQDEVDVLQHENRRQRSILDALYRLAEALPAEIKIQRLSIDPNGKLAIEGTTKSVEVASQKAVSALETSTAFTNPSFLGATKEKDDFGFQITCELSKTAGAIGP